MPKVLIADALSPRAAEILAARGIAVDFHPGLPAPELEECIGAYEGLAVRSATKVTKGLLAHAEKLRIVEESFSGPRLVSATARHHGLSKQLLFSWRKAYREGQLGSCQVGGFVPARIVSEVQSTTERAAPTATGTLEVVTANGRRVIVDRNVDVAVLLRIMRGLETLR